MPDIYSYANIKHYYIIYRNTPNTVHTLYFLFLLFDAASVREIWRANKKARKL